MKKLILTLLTAISIITKPITPTQAACLLGAGVAAYSYVQVKRGLGRFELTKEPGLRSIAYNGINSKFLAEVKVEKNK